MVLVERVNAVEHRLEAARDDGQRRPQLVGDVGEQRLAVRPRPVEALRHRVERRREAPHRPRATGPDPDARLAVGEAFRGAREVRKRPDRRTERPGCRQGSQGRSRR